MEGAGDGGGVDIVEMLEAYHLLLLLREVVDEAESQLQAFVLVGVVFVGKVGKIVGSYRWMTATQEVDTKTLDEGDAPSLAVDDLF